MNINAIEIGPALKQRRIVTFIVHDVPIVALDSAEPPPRWTILPLNPPPPPRRSYPSTAGGWGYRGPTNNIDRIAILLVHGGGVLILRVAS